MEDKHVISIVFAAVLIFAIGGIVYVFSSSATGMYSIYPQVPGNYIINSPDPGTGFVTIDASVCGLAQGRYNTFLTFVQLQCKRLNPGRLTSEAACRYQAQLDAQNNCLQAPVFENLQQPTMLV
jgi:hypothetical protein